MRPGAKASGGVLVSSAEEIEVKVRRKTAMVIALRQSPYQPFEPTEKQWQFLLEERREALLGGAAGPGKSVGLLMAALQYVHVPTYSALIIRRTFSDLAQPGAIMDMASEWLLGTDASPRRGGKEWVFPSGATLTFGHMAADKDRKNYLGANWQFVGVDECQTIPLPSYLFMFSRLRQTRKSAIAGVPLRVRATANPGGYEWVKTRFVDLHDKPDRRVFIPATMVDNPYLDVEAYRESLAELDPVSRAQYEHGDWNVQPAGNFFKVGLFGRVAEGTPMTGPVIRCRAWDMAATPDGGDYTVGALLAYDKGEMRWRVEHVVRGQWGPDDLERIVAQTAANDPVGTVIGLEQEPGSSGKLATRDMRRRILAGRDVRVVRPTGSKLERARLLASLVANGAVDLVQGAWCQSFTDELGAFPNGVHDDATDAAAHASHIISGMIASESVADTSAVDTFRRMSVVTSDAARSTGPPRGGIPGLSPPSSSPFGNTPFRR